jgi:hypothetical protein
VEFILSFRAMSTIDCAGGVGRFRFAPAAHLHPATIAKKIPAWDGGHVRSGSAGEQLLSDRRDIIAYREQRGIWGC